MGCHELLVLFYFFSTTLVLSVTRFQVDKACFQRTSRAWTPGAPGLHAICVPDTESMEALVVILQE